MRKKCFRFKGKSVSSTSTCFWTSFSSRGSQVGISFSWPYRGCIKTLNHAWCPSCCLQSNLLHDHPILAYAGAKVRVVTRSVSYCKVWLQSAGAACFGWASTAWTLPLSKAKVLSMWKKPCNFGASFHRLHLGHVSFRYGSLVWSFDLTNVSCVSLDVFCVPLEFP